jgi:HEAT repeat protein
MNIFTSTKQTALALTALLALGITAGAADPAPYTPPPIPTESALIEILNAPTATDNDKVTAAQQLGNIGTHTAVAPLVALLNSDKAYLRDAARYGLENNSCPSVEGTLVAAAGRLSGPARVGVVQSIGRRGNAKSVPLLAKFLADSDAALAKAAADSLGKLAIPEAFAALKPYLSKSPNATAAYLRGADRIAQKDPSAAHQYYTELLQNDASLALPVKQGALRGVILTGGRNGLELWAKFITGDDLDSANIALRSVTEYPASAEATETFANALAKVSPATQAKLVEVLATRGDKAAVPAIIKVADQAPTADNEAVRFAAARALVTLNDSTAARATFELLLTSADTVIASNAQEALRGLSYQTPAAEAAQGFKSMFNGKDLSEWRSGDGWWRVEKGILTAQSTKEKPCKKNSHLIWNGGEKGDFELRAEFRLSPDANSGIQFRAKDENADTSYQADMNGKGDYIGFLYHPKFHLVGKRGAKVVLGADNKKTTTAFANEKVLSTRAFKLNTWNEYTIIAKGRTITLFVNGIKTNEFVDNRPDAATTGVITLQMHQGPPMQIEYRNLRIRDL